MAVDGARRWRGARWWGAAGLLLALPAWGQGATVQTEPPAENSLETPTVIDRSVIPAWYRRPLAEWPAPTIDEGVTWVELSALPQPTWAERNTARVRLGQQLFFEPALSRSGQIACASCHDPAHAWADGRRVPFGHNRTPGTRNTPSILNSGLMRRLFWDGRADTLEAQVIMPLTDPAEMHHHPAGAEARIRALPDYAPRFEAAFGTPGIDYARITEALAAFERTVVSRPSEFDAFVGGNHAAMSEAAIRGLHWFRTQARCMNCHHGAVFSDQQFHNLGLHYAGRTYQDYGRYEVTGRDEDAGAFRTAPLRDVAHTAPYMHNGLFPTLRGVLQMYNAGGARPRPREGREYPVTYPVTDPLLKPLGLDRTQIDDLVAFLEALSPGARRLDGHFENQLRDRAMGRSERQRPAPGSPESDAVPIRKLPDAHK